MAINLNNLRIGNYIKFNESDFDEPSKIWEPNEDKFTAHDMLHFLEHDKNVKQAEYIMLNDDWVNSIKSKSEDVFWNNFSNDISGYFIWVGGHKIYIEYVHQLQNLHFDLTGKNLNLIVRWPKIFKFFFH